MKKMENAHFQEMAKQIRNKLITGISAMGILSLVALIFAINMRNATFVMGVLVPVLFVAVTCAIVAIFVLRLTTKIGRGQFSGWDGSC